MAEFMPPRTIKIGPMIYEVKLVNNLFGTGPNGATRWLSGRQNWTKSQMELDADLSAQAKLICTWHECLHAILEHAGYTDHPEGMIEAIAHGVVQLIRDNPSLTEESVKPYADAER